jgi:hypothetical protein
MRRKLFLLLCEEKHSILIMDQFFSSPKEKTFGLYPFEIKKISFQLHSHLSRNLFLIAPQLQKNISSA